ncbi:lipopolysaccharide assembly protein LapB [Ottowia sp.]|uniref:lipopolysaccharide assembly protein LapB n=1 Tax=Ottowia sp. TaxID=1898956 RepID=UPI002CB3670D|nr:lipopolysaccharide assembly protein LapB [Ottowia sp.]HRN74492.1 lipopolysaccharide assembly protein LapB [Ottowia sp.]HRQ02052.1 lipopolysaccharide assembly protein LapB [Ottowia sp.]
MELDLSWILLGLPIAFTLGWLASRLDLRQLRIENRQAPKAYFKGLNYLLNEQQDQAIDAFIEAVQRDPDTSELHFALGNLFRRRGEYERAVRVHEHLLSRADLSASDRERAQHALAQDFLKAGLLDRAEDALQRLEGTRYQEQAWLSLLALHERARDWPHATEIARRLQQAEHGDFAARLAHYQCELAATALSKHQDPTTARRLLTEAIEQSPASARPRIQLAGLLAGQGDMPGAFTELARLEQHAPQAIPLVASELVRIGQASGQLPHAIELLQRSYALLPSIDTADAIVQAQVAAGTPMPEAREGYVRHMTQEPSLIAAMRWLSHEPFAQDGAHPMVQRSLEHAARPLARYRCAACGFEAQGYFWQCPGCQAWESFPPKRIEEL